MGPAAAVPVAWRSRAVASAAADPVQCPHSSTGYRRVAATGVSTAFGTFGELLQGVLPQDEVPPGEDGNFLVTLPVARWAMARFELDWDFGELSVFPPHKKKALRLTSMITEDAGGAGGVLRIEGTLPEGKGLASSSADLVATARAVANALDEPMPAHRIESYLARIEPTDGVMYPAIGAYARLLERVTRAIARTDLAEVGRVATASARMNQVLRHKRQLDAMIRICEDVGGLGVAVAHSGTTLGILLDGTAPDHPARLAAAAQSCQELAGEVTVFHTLTF
ncbi:GHMP family kinase ATP-binding protein [Streptomyces olivochromogenes]|uniref:GHMP family kinase ATP-binding protein n=1 Tax=Streptomyces olivochromogenes TaxID=1963 RepID=UPI0036B8024F